MKHRKLKTAIVLAFVLAVWIFTQTVGPLDTYPRVQQIVKSSDGTWMFEAYHRKLEPLNPLADSEIVFRIKDVAENRVSEKRIWRTRWWVGFGSRNFDVRFERDVIVVNEFWVADRTNLDFRMCPLLECLTESH